MAQVLTSDEALKRGAQVGNRMLVDGAHLRQRGDRIVEVERGDERRAEHKRIRKFVGLCRSLL